MSMAAHVCLRICRLDQSISDLEERRAEVQTARQERTAWLIQHPEEIAGSAASIASSTPSATAPNSTASEGTAVGRERDLGIWRRNTRDHGIDLGF
jgi:hypothetical protein